MRLGLGMGFSRALGFSPISPGADTLLQENGFALLQEDGSYILLEP